jgi:hypothetical protein
MTTKLPRPCWEVAAKQSQNFAVCRYALDTVLQDSYEVDKKGMASCKLDIARLPSERCRLHR